MKKIAHSCIFLVHQRVREKKGLLYYTKHVKNYMKKLFVIQKQYRQEILAYQILDDTVYFLIAGDDIDVVSKFLQHLHGVVAADYSKSKDKEGPFWSRRPRYTLIQSGFPFLRCLSLLMRFPIEKDRVIHPTDWPHSSFRSSIKPRKRYRILSRDSLVRASGLENHQSFTNWLIQDIERNQCDELTLEEIGESFAFGDNYWIQALYKPKPYSKVQQKVWSSTLSLLIGSKDSRKYLEEVLTHRLLKY
jgi:REP element-mobilizing transposase RayT